MKTGLRIEREEEEEEGSEVKPQFGVEEKTFEREREEEGDLLTFAAFESGVPSFRRCQENGQRT